MSDTHKHPGRLDQPDITANERSIVRALRTESGWWNGDARAIEVLREKRPEPIPNPAYDTPGVFVQIEELHAAEKRIAELEAVLKMVPTLEHPMNPNDEGRKCLCSQCELARAVVALKLT